MADASRCCLLLTPAISLPQGEGQTDPVSITLHLLLSLAGRVSLGQACSTTFAKVQVHKIPCLQWSRISNIVTEWG